MMRGNETTILRNRYVEALCWAIDTENEHNLKNLLSPENFVALHDREMEKCFRFALHHHNENIISLLLNSSIRPSGAFLAREFEQCAMKLTNPRLLLVLQEYLRPTDRAEKIRCGSSRDNKEYYVVDPVEVTLLDNLKRAILAPRKKCSLMFLSKKNTINDAFIDAVLGDRRLIALSLLEEFPEEFRPSPATIDFTFCRSIHSHSRPMASLLARYISSRAFEEAFLDTAENGDVDMLQWLLSGRLGFIPSEAAVDRAYVSLFPDTLPSSHLQRPPPSSRGNGQDTLTVTQRYLYGVLRARVSGLLSERILREEKRRREGRSRQAFSHHVGAQMTDIHAFSRHRVAVEDDRSGGDSTGVVAGGGRQSTADGRRNMSVNDAVVHHMERRVGGRSLPDQRTTLSRLAHLVDAYIPAAQRDGALTILSDVFNRSTAHLFALTLSFLDSVHEDGTTLGSPDSAAGLWIMGFLSESVLVHSCNPGAVERVVTGLRGLNDSQLDAIFSKAEGPALAVMFLKNTLNIFSNEPAISDQAITLGQKNARNLARELHCRGITTHSCFNQVKAAIIDYALEEISSYRVDPEHFVDDIEATADVVADSFESMLKDLVGDMTSST